MPLVFIPAQLRKLAGGQETVPVNGSTLGEVMTNLDALCPGLRALLVEGERIRPGLAVAVDSEVVDGWLSLKLGKESEIHFVPPLSGG